MSDTIIWMEWLMPDMEWQFAGVVGVHRDHPLIVWTVCVLCTSHGNGRLCVNENEWGAEIVLESASLSGQPPLPPRLSLLCMPWNLSGKNFCCLSQYSSTGADETTTTIKIMPRL